MEVLSDRKQNLPGLSKTKLNVFINLYLLSYFEKDVSETIVEHS